MLLSADDAMSLNQLVQCDSTVFRKSGCCLSVENLNSRQYGNQLRETTQIADMKQAGYTRFWDVRWFCLLWLIHVGFGFKSVAAVLCPPPASACLYFCLSVCSPTCSPFFFLFFFSNSHMSTHPHMANRADCHQMAVIGLNPVTKHAHKVLVDRGWAERVEVQNHSTKVVTLGLLIPSFNRQLSRGSNTSKSCHLPRCRQGRFISTSLI